MCDSSEVLYANANDCHAPGGLRAAAKAGDSDLVNHFIAEHGADVNEGSGGVTPLHWAANGGHVAIAAALLAAGADVSLTTGSGQTPLHWAANGGYAAVVATLLAADAEVNAKSDDGGTPLRFAAGGGHVSAVAELLAGGADVDAKNDDGETPLHWAARNGRAAVVVALLAAGAEVNAKNDDDETPLRFAVDGGHSAVAAALIAAGGHWGAVCAAPAVVNLAGSSPPCVSVEVCEGLNQFYDAALLTCVPIAVCDSSEVLYANANDCHAPGGLRAAAKAGDLDLVNHFIAEHGADVNEGSGGVTPLHWAADGGACRHCRGAACGGGGCEFDNRRRPNAAALGRQRRLCRGCRHAACGGRGSECEKRRRRNAAALCRRRRSCLRCRRVACGRRGGGCEKRRRRDAVALGRQKRPRRRCRRRCLRRGRM